MKKATTALAGVALAVMGLGVSGCAASGPNAAISGKIGFSNPQNPASVAFAADVKNAGPDASGWSCQVKFHDTARAYSGFDTFTSTKELAAGSKVNFTGQVVVTGDGAAYATEREIDCQPQRQS